MKYGPFFLLFLFSNISFGNEINNSVIAIVNDNVITYQEIQAELNSASSFDQKISIVNKNIDLVIQNELIEKYDLNPSDYEINEALIHIAKKNNISISSLRQNQNFEYIKNDIVKQLSIFNLKIFLTKDIEFHISNEDIYLNCDNKNKDFSEQIMIAEIVIYEPYNSNYTKFSKNDKIKNYLIKLSNHISKGASFYSLAKLHSQEPSYLHGGVSEWKNIDTSFLSKIDKLPLNKVSNIYQKGNGWAIAIKVDERKIDLELEKCKKRINNIRAENFFENYINNYRNKSDIIIYKQKL
jgi:peptidyl-prolyl cis-trans isomerase SurA